MSSLHDLATLREITAASVPSWLSRVLPAMPWLVREPPSA